MFCSECEYVEQRILTICFSYNLECLTLAFFAFHLYLHHKLLLQMQTKSDHRRENHDIHYIYIYICYEPKITNNLWLQIIPSCWQFNFLSTHKRAKKIARSHKFLSENYNLYIKTRPKPGLYRAPNFSFKETIEWLPMAMACDKQPFLGKFS